MRMVSRTGWSLLVAALTLPAVTPVGGAEPDVAIETEVPGVEISLVAEHPDLVTPTGIDVDDQGRVWLVACHTHMPNEDYPGPEFDEILVFDTDGSRTVFYDRTHHTMDLELGANGWVYLAERDRIFRIRDSDGDGVADVEEDLAVLETEADYPHNGLAGLAWHPGGELVFGLGENFAKGWRLTGVDGREYTGRGEGGVFRCLPDGSSLRRIARGMWNPFGITVCDDGEIFATDNDPGERPPCRLLHIVEGGDYGYQRIYGGEAHHPFVCWNGEMRGTLPMVHPTGEAPCGVVSFRGGLLVPSWSDHRIDFFPLSRSGASYSSNRISLVQGSRYFRPTCIAEDASSDEPGKRTWYLTDWVDGRYQVHGYGRLWKLEIDLEEASSWIGPEAREAPNEEARLLKSIQANSLERTRETWFELARHDDPFVARAALLRLADDSRSWSPKEVQGWGEKKRILAVLALALGEASPEKWIPSFLQDESSEVVFEALRWTSNAQADEFLPEVEAILERSDLRFEVFEAAVAAWNTLSGVPENGVRNPEKLLARVLDEGSSPRLRAYALRLLPSPARVASESDPHARIRIPKELSVSILGDLLTVEDVELSREVIRILAGSPRSGTAVLLEVAGDGSRSAELRAEAVAGLHPSAEGVVPALLELAGDDSKIVREEALRGLRGSSLDQRQKAVLEKERSRFPGSADAFAFVLDPTTVASGRPAMDDVDGWLARLDAVESAADPLAGERIFHHAAVALCANCHRHDGRGNIVGPDLSGVASRGERRWLLQSILEPGLEIAPEYLPRTVTLKDGTTHTGIRLRSWVREQLRDANGNTLTFDRDDVASIEETTISFMPPGLVYGLTDEELRDLLAFLGGAFPAAER